MCCLHWSWHLWSELIITCFHSIFALPLISVFHLRRLSWSSLEMPSWFSAKYDNSKSRASHIQKQRSFGIPPAANHRWRSSCPGHCLSCVTWHLMQPTTSKTLPLPWEHVLKELLSQLTNQRPVAEIKQEATQARISVRMWWLRSVGCNSSTILFCRNHHVCMWNWSWGSWGVKMS